MLALTALLALAAPPAKPISMLVMPVVTGAGASSELSEIVTSAISVEVGRDPRFAAVSLDEVKQVLNQDQLRQVAGCDSVSCAIELAGALDTQQALMGSVRVLGGKYVVTLSRVDARTARVYARALAKVSTQGTQLVDRIPSLVREVLGGPVDGSAPVEQPAAKGPNVLRLLSLVPLGLGGLGMLGALGLGALTAGLVGYDVANDGRWGGTHAVTGLMAVMGNAALYGAIGAGLVAVLLLGTGAVVLGASVVL